LYGWNLQLSICMNGIFICHYTPAPPEEGYTVLPLAVLPSIQDIFRRIFLSNYWWQKSDIWLQASYRYAILWEAFLDPSDSYFLFAKLVGFYTHWTYMRGYHKWALAHSTSCFVWVESLCISLCEWNLYVSVCVSGIFVSVCGSGIFMCQFVWVESFTCQFV